MLQAIMTQPGKIEFRQIPCPEFQPDEVLIQVQRIGVCGSDIHVFHGLHPYTSYPVVQGHEVAGVIAEVGAQVKGFAPGDQAVFMPQVTCGTCFPCRHGMYHICDDLKVMGFQTNGAAQEYFLVRAEMVLKLPEPVSLDHAALVEPISVAVHALSRCWKRCRVKYPGRAVDGLFTGELLRGCPRGAAGGGVREAAAWRRRRLQPPVDLAARPYPHHQYAENGPSDLVHDPVVPDSDPVELRPLELLHSRRKGIDAKRRRLHG